ncbi:MAG TPA: ABC transporter permease [Gemmataceae bacterium]|jgi:putative ABC transport system permease protein|nr:ABC transporter permease [Gemmataceae bacterium]
MNFISFVLKNLTRRPVRTALTVLGLAVAVGSMIALLGISHNVQRTVAAGFERRGLDLVVLQAGVADQLSSDLDEHLVDAVKKIPGVDPDGVDIALVQYLALQKPSGSIDNVVVIGWPAGNNGFDDLHILKGRRLAAGDRDKAMLGSKLAGNLHMGVGDRLDISEKQFEIVGVFESFSVFENGAVVTLLGDAQSLTTSRKGRISGFSVRVEKSIEHPDADIEAVRQRIDSMKDAEGKSLHLAAQTIKEYMQTASHLNIMKAMTWMVSVIAIVIGIISMLNTMIMSVLERTQEIGILRAVGWPKSRIVRMVLGEAIALGLAAAAFGALGAWGFIYLLTLFPKVNGFIESGIAPVVIAEGFGLTLLIGLLGAVYPAIRAARLLPTEAIRHD